MKIECIDCGSSDACEVYPDGHSYCFSCEKYRKEAGVINESNPIRSAVGSTEQLIDVQSYRSYPITSRGISQEVVDHFNVKMSVNEDGKPEAHYYPYTRRGQAAAYKVRQLPKDFRVLGEFKDVELFGQSTPGVGRNRVIITEGELDALAVAEAMHQKTAKIFGGVVSLPSATGLKTLLEQRDWVNTFKEIVLCFDQDDAGQAAVDKAAKMFPAGKVKIAVLPEKDPCEVLMKHGADVLDKCLYNAQTWSPAGIVTGEAIWDQFIERQNVESVPYPDCLDGLNHKLKGIRHIS